MRSITPSSAGDFSARSAIDRDPVVRAAPFAGERLFHRRRDRLPLLVMLDRDDVRFVAARADEQHAVLDGLSSDDVFRPQGTLGPL